MLLDQPAKDGQNNESRDKQDGNVDVLQDDLVQQITGNSEKKIMKEEEFEDGTVESMESLMNKAFKGQRHLGDPAKVQKDHPDDDGEDDDDDDVEIGSSGKSMMMTGLLNMALNAEMLGGLEPVDEVDEEKSESALTSARDSDETKPAREDIIDTKISGHSPEKKDLTQNIGEQERKLQKIKERPEKDAKKISKEAKRDGGINKGVEKLNPGLPVDLQHLKDDVHSLKNDFKAMKKDVNEIKVDVGDIKKDVKSMNKNMKTDLRVIKESFSGLREGTVASSIVETASEIDALIEGRAVGRDITVREDIVQLLNTYCSNILQDHI